MSASPASILYSSAGAPVGVSFAASIYRGTNSGGVITIPATPLSGSTGKLGTYVVEMFTPNFKGTVVERRDATGADADFALLRQAATGSVTVQSASATTPIVLPGDCFEVVIGKDVDGSTDLPYARFVFTDASPGMQQGEIRKQTGSLRLDRQNSSSSLTQF
jgi:hypothetical protein